jgi:8-oxo-dGTP pyrophosphatase MutT (NUDIX family)
METIDKLAWLLVVDRKVLYVRSKGKDLFFNAGGKREGSETDEQALIREIREELGVSLVPASIKYLAEFSAPAHGKVEGTLVRIKCFSADHQGELSPQSEIDELAWFSSKDRERTTATGKLILDWLAGQGMIA